MKKIITILIIMLTLVSLYRMMPQMDSEKLHVRTVEDFNREWKYETEGKNGTVTLPVKISLARDTPVTLIKKIPQEKNKNTLAFKSYYQNVRAVVEGKTIYERKNYKTAKRNNATTYGWNFISLPEESSGKMIEISFSSPYRNYAGKIQSIKIGTQAELLLQAMSEERITYIIDIGFLLMGITLLVLSVFLRRSRQSYYSIRCLGESVLLVELCFGTGILNSPLAELDPYFQLFLSYVSLGMIPIAFLRFFKTNSFQSSRLLEILNRILIGNYVVVLLFHMFGIADFIETTILTQIGIVCLILLIFYEYIKKMKTNSQNKPILEFAGVLLFSFFSLIEIVRAYGNNSNGGVFVRSGFMVFIIFLTISVLLQYEKRKKENFEQEKKLQTAKTQLAISQISPHFIFNALGAIRIMIKTNPNAAYQMVYDFSKYLQANLESLETQEQIPFIKELNHIKAYANIEEIRFGKRVKVEYEIEAKDFFVLPLSIQPLVENAIHHGLRKGKKEGTVIIRTYETAQNYIVEIEDNGVGFEAEPYKREPEEVYYIGISNIRYRLHKMMNANIDIQSEIGKGTLITLEFPKSTEELHENNISR